MKKLVACLALALPTAPPGGVGGTADRPTAAGRFDPQGSEWQWNGSGWTLIFHNCAVTPTQPSFDGSYVGQTVYMPCPPPFACGCAARHSNH